MIICFAGTIWQLVMFFTGVCLLVAVPQEVRGDRIYNTNISHLVAVLQGRSNRITTETSALSYARNGQTLVTAITDPSVSFIHLIADVHFSEDDWSHIELPYLLQRNVTITSARDLPGDWFVLDFNYVQRKIRPIAGVFITFNKVVLDRWREGPLFQGPGLDIFAPGPNPGNYKQAPLSEWPIVVIHDAYASQRTCLPLPYQGRSARSFPRPIQFPGNQSDSPNVPQDGCENNVSARPPKRCWTMVGRYNDIALIGSDFNMTSKAVVQAGYMLYVLRVTFICLQVMKEECVNATGSTVGCFLTMFPPNSTYSERPMLLFELQASDAGGGNESGGNHTHLENSGQDGSSSSSGTDPSLGPILGGVLGGVALLSAVGVIALLFYRRHHGRRKQYSSSQPKGLTDITGNVCIPSSSQMPQNRPRGCDNGDDDLPAVGPQPRSDPRFKGPSLQMYDDPELVPITTLTPLQPGVKLNVQMEGQLAELKLTTTVRGKGGFGRVVEGTYGGVRVAVKLFDFGLLASPLKAAVAAAASSTPNAAAPFPSGPKPAEPLLQGTSTPEQQLCPRLNICSEPGLEDERSPVSGAAATTVTPLTCQTTPIQETAASALDPDAAQCAGLSQQVRVVGAFAIAIDAAAAFAAAGTTDLSRADLQQQPALNMSSSVTVGDVCSCMMEDRCAIKGARAGLCESAAGANKQAQQSSTEQSLTASTTGDHGGAQSMSSRQENAPSTADEGKKTTAALLFESTIAQEVAVLARCQHPNIVRLLAACLKRPTFCLVMELMDTSLDKLLYGEQAKLMPLNKVLHIATQVARGLAYLHPTIVHRDLKPGNVLISQPESMQPVVKLADFGLSRLHDTVLVTRHPEVGTAPYIAPEVFDLGQNFVVTNRVDIYAFGVLLWEMLSGMRPWHGVNIVLIALNVHFYRKRLPLQAIPDGRCPPKLRSLIEACWEHEPSRRPAAPEIVKSLALVQQLLSISPAGMSQD